MLIAKEMARNNRCDVLAGDCNQIGDFMTAVRDGWMLALGFSRAAPRENPKMNGNRN